MDRVNSPRRRILGLTGAAIAAARQGRVLADGNLATLAIFAAPLIAYLGAGLWGVARSARAGQAFPAQRWKELCTETR